MGRTDHILKNLLIFSGVVLRRPIMRDREPFSGGKDDKSDRS
jgi:hypothetical protein